MKKGLIEDITDTIRATKSKTAKKPRKKGVNKNTFVVSSITDYVDKMVNSALSPSQKRKIGIEFIRQTGIDRAELVKERNRHPYYKKLKNRTHAQRQRKRNELNKGINNQTSKWTKKELFDFLALNDKKSDKELALYFNRSIPAINAIRRRINLIKKTDHEKDMKIYILRDERTLRKKLL